MTTPSGELPDIETRRAEQRRRTAARLANLAAERDEQTDADRRSRVEAVLRRRELAAQAERIKAMAREAATYLQAHGVEPTEIDGAMLTYDRPYAFVVAQRPDRKLRDRLRGKYSYESIRVWVADTGQDPTEPTATKPAPGKLAFDAAGELYVLAASPDQHRVGLAEKNKIQGHQVTDDAALALGPERYRELNHQNPKPPYRDEVFEAWQDCFTSTLNLHLD